MANDRIFLVCTHCGEMVLLAKFHGAGSLSAWEGEPVPWMQDHLQECHEQWGMGLPDDRELFVVRTEGQLAPDGSSEFGKREGK